MKVSFSKFLLIILCFIGSSFSQQESDLNAIVVALNQGNSNKLSNYFDNRIDITLPEMSNNFSRTQAELILKDFFSNNSVKSFDLKHNGEKDGSKYCIGTLNTKTGKYRTVLFLKQKGNKLVLQEIGFQALE